jgi:hypothetical protein
MQTEAVSNTGVYFINASADISFSGQDDAYCYISSLDTGENDGNFGDTNASTEHSSLTLTDFYFLSAGDSITLICNSYRGLTTFSSGGITALLVQSYGSNESAIAAHKPMYTGAARNR